MFVGDVQEGTVDTTLVQEQVKWSENFSSNQTEIIKKKIIIAIFVYFIKFTNKLGVPLKENNTEPTSGNPIFSKWMTKRWIQSWQTDHVGKLNDSSFHSKISLWTLVTRC